MDDVFDQAASEMKGSTSQYIPPSTNNPFDDAAAELTKTANPQANKPQSLSDQMQSEKDFYASNPSILENIKHQAGNIAQSGYDTGVGMLKGAAGFAPHAINAVSNLFSSKKVIDPNSSLMKSLEPNNFSQNVGNQLGEALPFVAGGELVGGATKGAGLLARMLGRGAADAVVADAQNEGDHPLQSLATGAMGAVGEGAGSLLNKIKGSDIYKKITTMAPSAENYSKSMLATPTQTEALTRIGEGGKTVAERLAADGIVPTGDLGQMHQQLKNKMAQIGGEYNAATWNDKIAPVNDIVSKLEKLKDDYRVNGSIPSTAQSNIDAIDKAIADVSSAGASGAKPVTILGANGKPVLIPNRDQIKYSDMQKLKNGWNDSVNFSDPPSEQGVARKIGDIYRDVQDQVAPQGRALNQKYSEYKGVYDAAQKNLDRLKDSVKSPLNRLLGNNLTKLGTMGLGAVVGSHFGSAGEMLGAMAGPIIHDSITTPTLQMAKNAMDNGLTKSAAQPLARALASGNNKLVQQIISANAKSKLAGSPAQANQ